MLIALCSLLAAAPVSASLLPRSSVSFAPQSSAVRLLDSEDDGYSEPPLTEADSPSFPRGLRIAAEAVSGLLLGAAGAAGGFLGAYWVFGAGTNYSSPAILAAPLFGIIGFELGEILGVGGTGFGLGARGSLWTVALGQLGGILASMLVSPLIGMIGMGLVLAGGAWLLPAVAIASGVVGVALPIAGAIMALEMSPENQSPSEPQYHPVGDTAALTIHF